MPATYGPGPDGPIVLASTGSATTTFDSGNKSANITLSGGNLVAACNSTNTNGNVVRSVASHSSGKYYAEFTLGTVVTVGGMGFGLINASQSVTAQYLGDTGNNSIGAYGQGTVFRNNSNVGTFSAGCISGDVICMAVDLTNQSIWWRKNGGNWNNSGVADPATNTGGLSITLLAAPLFAAVDLETNTESGTANFGATAYAQTAPSGFGNW